MEHGNAMNTHVIPGHRMAMSPEPITASAPVFASVLRNLCCRADGFRARLCRPGMTAFLRCEDGASQL